MSKFKVQQPAVIHTPTFNKWVETRSKVTEILRELGIELLYPGVHGEYTYTDEAGVAALLPDLIMRSDIYRSNTFTCINYAFRVWNEASLRYGLNTWVPVIGHIPVSPVGRHAWNLILLGDETGLKKDRFLYFEPNDGWMMSIQLELAYQAFPIGEEGYDGEMVFY